MQFWLMLLKKLRWWTNSARIDRLSWKGLNGKQIKSLLTKCHLARSHLGPISFSDRNSAKGWMLKIFSSVLSVVLIQQINEKERNETSILLLMSSKNFQNFTKSSRTKIVKFFCFKKSTILFLQESFSQITRKLARLQTLS